MVIISNFWNLQSCVATCSVHITLGVFHSESGEPAIKATR